MEKIEKPNKNKGLIGLDPPPKNKDDFLFSDEPVGAFPTKKPR